MVKTCVVENCFSGRKNNKKTSNDLCSVSFFRPTTPARLQRWTQSLGIALKTTDKICHYHFQEKDIQMYDKTVYGGAVHYHLSHKKILQPDALPTIEHQFQLTPELQKQLQIQQKSVQSEPVQEKQQHLEPPQEFEHMEHSDQQRQQQADEMQWQEHCNLQRHHEQPTPEVIRRIECVEQKISALPPYWLYVTNPNKIEFMRLDPATKRIRNHLVLNEDMSVTVIVSDNEKINLGDKISSSDEIFNYLKSVEKWPQCVGIEIERQRYSNFCKGVIIGDDVYRRNQIYPRCKSCRALRRHLQCHKSTLNSAVKKMHLKKTE